MRFVFLLIFLLTSSAFAAESKIYRTVDENGNPVFTDIPPRNAPVTKAEITVNPANTYQSGSLRPAYEPGLVTNSADSDENFYQILDVTSPGNEESFRDNAGNVQIEGHMQPNLQAAHQLKLILDGVMTEQKAEGLQFNLSNVDRGSHQIQLVIVDDQGSHLITSKTSTFHLQRYATPQPKAPSSN